MSEMFFRILIIIALIGGILAMIQAKVIMKKQNKRYAKEMKR